MLRLGIAFGLAATIVALVAVVDHRHKQEVSAAAQVDAWFCAHGRPSACRDFDGAAYEARWERRELGYRLGFFGLAAGAATFVVVAVRRRHVARQ